MLESDTLVASCTEIRFGSPDREKNANSSAYHTNFSISRIRLYRNRDSRQLNASTLLSIVYLGGKFLGRCWQEETKMHRLEALHYPQQNIAQNLDHLEVLYRHLSSVVPSSGHCLTRRRPRRRWRDWPAIVKNYAPFTRNADS